MKDADMTYKGIEIPGWIKVFVVLITIASAVGATLSTFVTKIELKESLQQEKTERIRTDEKSEEARRDDMREIRNKFDTIIEQLNKKQNRKD